VISVIMDQWTASTKIILYVILISYMTQKCNTRHIRMFKPKIDASKQIVGWQM